MTWFIGLATGFTLVLQVLTLVGLLRLASDVLELKRDKALRLDSEEIGKLRATIVSLKADKFSLDNKQQESSTKLAELNTKLRTYEQELERRAEALSKIMSVLKGE
jgi:uncharacterized protein YlxW (UPF0749 family)